MILCVSPNPAWDITYTVPDLTLHGVHHVADVVELAGGKGMNVASVARAAGYATSVCAPVGGARRADFEADLIRRGLATDLVDSPLPTRRSIAVVDPSGVTMLNEAGRPQPAEVWERLVATVRAGAATAGVVTVSGSLPPGTPDDLVARLVRAAHDGGAAVVLDCRGPHLLAALEEAPELVKPNASEALETTGRHAPLDAARALVGLGAGAALISLGADGLVLVDGSDRALRAHLTVTVTGNPTGAGDALTAVLAMALHDDRAVDWRSVLRTGVAWSAAAVTAPVAGVVDPATAEELSSHVIVEEIP